MGLTILEQKAIDKTNEILGNSLDETKLSFLKMWNDNLMVVSCAGSGKTNLCKGLIISRILSYEVTPEEVLYLSFSKDCIADTKKALSLSLEKADIDGNCDIRTVHSFFYHQLEKLGVISSLGNQVLSVTEEQNLMAKCRRAKAFYDMSPNDLLGLYECECEGLETREHLGARLFDLTNAEDKLKFERALSVIDLYKELKGSQIGLSEYGLILLSLISDEGGERVKDYARNLGISDTALTEEERESYLTILRRIVSKYKLVVIDEVQDLNVVQHKVLELLFGVKAKRKSDTKIVLVGDDDQCLPTGTLVYTDHGVKSVENVTYEDKLLCGGGKGSVVYGKIDKITSKDVETELYTIKTSKGHIVSATGNHIGFSFNLTKPYAKSSVYLDMFGGKYKTRDKCYFTEITVDKEKDFESYQTLPRLQDEAYKEIGEQIYRLDNMSKIYKQIKQNTFDTMERVFLSKYHYYTPTRFDELQVGMLVPVYDKDTDEIIVDEIVEISKEDYIGKVYDFSVPHIRNFIANNVVVHNCIYEWRFSNVDLMRTAPLKYGLKTVYMDKSYRCADNIMELGSEILATSQDKNRWEKDLKGRGTQGQLIKIGTKCHNLKERVDAFGKYLSAYEFSKEMLTESGVVLSRFRSSIVPICIGLYEEENKIVAQLDSSFPLDTFISVYKLEGTMNNEKSYRDIKTICNLFVDRKPIREVLNYLIPMMCPFINNTQKANLISFTEEYGISFIELAYLFNGDNAISLMKGREEDEARLYISHLQVLTSKMYSVTRQKFESLYNLCVNMENTTDGIDALAFSKYLVRIVIPRDETKSLMKKGLYGDIERATFICDWVCKKLDEQTDLKGNHNLMQGLNYILGLFRSFESRYSQDKTPTVSVMSGQKTPMVAIKTVHASKGLQWRTVFFIDCDLRGVEQMKRKRLVKATTELNEETRISYVGVTRAKDRLIV